MIRLSLLINIVVLVPVCWGILRSGEWVPAAYGTGSPALGILVSVYLAILLFSIVLMVWPDTRLVLALLGVQVIYKFLSPLTVGDASNPVVTANLMIALFHSVTIIVILSKLSFLKVG